MRARLVMVVVAALACSAVAGARQQAANGSARPAAQGATAPEGRADVGRTLYMKNGCFQCHGQEAQGGAAGPRLGPGPLPFAAFRTYVRNPRNDMPPYTAKVLPDAALAHIHAFLRAQPQPPAVSTIPLLRP